MIYDFNQHIDRRRFESLKWHRYDEDVLPMWVADMDFQAPEPVIHALQTRVEHGVFGYGKPPCELREVLVDRLHDRYDWHVSPEALVFLPGVVPGFNLACHAVAAPGDGVLIQTPVYGPIRQAPGDAGLSNDEMALTQRPDGTYDIDFDLFERVISDRTRIFILCNPHNPVGRVFRRGELQRMADVCLRHAIIICSDEIHCDLLLDDNVHTPIASLAPEVGQQTITLMAPSKTYNIAGLKCAVAIVENPALRERLDAARRGLVSSVNVLGYTAALAAYRDGQPWLEAALRYLEANRDLLMDYVARQLPGISMGKPEGTYLAWLSCHRSAIPGNPCAFFRDKAKVALVDGAVFGHGGEGFVRLNFGCPRSMLVEALERMKRALSSLDGAEAGRTHP
jgi:cystathionine beta-lyase